MTRTEIVQRGWDAFGVGDFDALVKDYTEDMSLIMPGQDDVLRGREEFRSALDGIGALVPKGFELTALRHIEGEDEVVSLANWKSDTVPDSQVAILFRFRGDKIYEERWFVDTEQWKGAL